MKVQDFKNLIRIKENKEWFNNFIKEKIKFWETEKIINTAFGDDGINEQKMIDIYQLYE